MDLNVIAKQLGLEVKDLTFARNPKFIVGRVKPPDRDMEVAAEVRCSDDRQGKEKSVGDQVEEICQAVQDLYGLERGQFPIYQDNSKSASDHGVYRPEWEELCKLVATYGAVDVIPCWAVNRLSRLHTEGKHFMWLCWRNDVRILVVKEYLEDKADGGDGTRGEYNLRRNRDWDAIEQAFKEAEKESQGKSQDITRGHAGSRRKGKLGGAAPAGWVRKYDPVTRAPHHEVDLPRAAVLVREVKELASGTTPSMIAHMLNQDGISPFTPPRKDGTLRNRWGRWSAQAVVVTALNPIHIGKICAKPLGLDKRRDLTALDDAADYFPIVQGLRKGEEWTAAERKELLGWDGTVEGWVECWYAARDKYLLSRGKDFNISKVRPGGSTHMQSFLSRCDRCGGPLRLAMANGSGGHITYLTCEKSGHVSVREDWADEYVTELVVDKLARLVRDGGYRAEQPGKLAEVLKRRDEKIAYWDARIASLEEKAAGEKGAKATEEAEEKKKAALAKLDAEVRALRIPVVIREYLGTKGDPALVAAKWAAKDMSARRAELKVLALITVSKSPLGRAQALRLSEEKRRQVARSQVHVEWREDYRQGSDGAHADDGGERIRAIPVSPDVADWGVPPEGMKWCTGECKRMLPLDAEHFYRASSTEKTRPTADGWANVCKSCVCARQRRYKAERREAATAAALPVIEGEEAS